MNIAICDDDLYELTHIKSLLECYNQENGTTITYKTYGSAVELLSTAQVSEYDLLIMDIIMPGFTGIQAAQEVRTFDEDIKIIFLTSSPEFAVESYSVKATDYLLKPILKEKFFSVLDSMLTKKKTLLDGFYIKTHGGMARIVFSKLVYVEVVNKKLYFYMVDGSVREVIAPLSEYEEKLLAHREFIKVHRAYVVNLWHMEELTTNGFITDTGKSIPISRLLYADVKKKYMEHLFM
ncbi:MAG: LytTR family DNA-binding domain-containing protein [Oscillospiraceae bacterium]